MDESGPGGKGDRVKEYSELFTIGLSTAAAVLALISGADKLKAMVASFSTGTPTFHAILPAVLFLQTILLGVSWYVSGKHELSLLAEYYGRHAPARSFATLPLIIFVATVIVILSYFSDKILVYSCLYAVYLLFAVAGGWLSTQHVLKAIRDGKTDSSIPVVYRDEVYRYYVLRPGPVLGYVCGAITFLAITMAILGRHSPTPGDRQRAETIAYLAMSGGILLGESVVWSWRARLYSKTRDE